MKQLAFIAATLLVLATAKAEPNNDLPPEAWVRQALAQAPAVLVADSLLETAKAQNQRITAGSYEWNLRIGGQRRRINPANMPDERHQEWNAAIERPWRLPGKAALDTQLGASVELEAEVARGDARHESARQLLSHWFAWVRESQVAQQWRAQLALLQQQNQAVQRRQQLGDAARIETVQAAAATAQAAAQLAQQEVRQRAAAEVLRQLYPSLSLPATLALSPPGPINGSESEWINAVIAHNHELALAQAEQQRLALSAERSHSERRPDPTVGLQLARERSGEEAIFGVYIAIPLAGEARNAITIAANAEAEAARRRLSAAQRKVALEASSLYYQASAAYQQWQNLKEASDRLNQAADMIARAYQLGEGSLSDLLNARRLANEASLASTTAHADALESRYRLHLDAHRLWDFDNGAAGVAHGN